METPAQEPLPLPIGEACRGLVLWLGHPQDVGGHGLASGRGEDKAQGCSSSGVMFKIFTTNMAETLTNQMDPRLLAEPGVNSSITGWWGALGIPGGRSVCLGVRGEGEDSK